jgi:hypothetical protein
MSAVRALFVLGFGPHGTVSHFERADTKRAAQLKLLLVVDSSAGNFLARRILAG